MIYNKGNKTKEGKEKHMEKLKQSNAITLIALVVTIVVLLILAGVSIQLLLDENGIIAKSKEAKLNARIAEIETEIGMWRQENFINKETKQANTKPEVILQKLKTQKLITDDEIDSEKKLIIIKKRDGSVAKEISYSNIQINISQTAVEGGVLLKVTSVEGVVIPTINCSDEQR